jgi:hypothetical protein
MGFPDEACFLKRTRHQSLRQGIFPLDPRHKCTSLLRRHDVALVTSCPFISIQTLPLGGPSRAR